MSSRKPGHDLTYKALLISICICFFSLSVGTAPLTLSSLLALTIWLLSGRCYKDRSYWLGEDWLVPVTALCVLPWIAILWSTAPLSQALKFAERSHYWLFAFVAASTLRSERMLRNTLVSFVAGTLIIAIIRFLHSNGIIPQTTCLNKAFAGSYITYSLLVVISIALLAFFYRTIPVRNGKIMVVVAMVALVIEITQLNGRSGYLSLAILSPWLFVTMFGRHRLISVFVAVLAMLIILFSSQKVQERISLIPKEIRLYQSGVVSSYKKSDGSVTPSSVGLRMMMWKDALKIFCNYPLLGAGTGAYQLEAKKINPDNLLPHPHNSYLYIMANYGLLGLILYGWLLVVTIKRAWLSRGQLSGHSILAFLLVVLIGSLTDTQLLSVATGIALGFIVGIPTPSTTECAS